MELRDLAKFRWRERSRRVARLTAVQRFVSAFIFGAMAATLAAIIIGAIKQ